MMILGLALIGGIIAYALGWRPEFLTNLLEASQTSPEKRKWDARDASGEITPKPYEQVRQDLSD